MSPQDRMLLDYLIENGSITGLEALKHLGILSYTKRISCLRALGVQIDSQWISKKSRFGLKRFVKYVLLKVPSSLLKK